MAFPWADKSNAGMDNMLVSHCTMTGTTSGFRLKADATQGGPVQNVTYTDVQMTNVTYPIVFYSYYADIGKPGEHRNQWHRVSYGLQHQPAQLAFRDNIAHLEEHYCRRPHRGRSHWRQHHLGPAAR